MEVKAGDMPGLLSRIGETLDKFGVRVRSAQITTLGEQAEDIFYVTTRNDELRIDPVWQEQVRNAIIEALKV